MKKKKKTVPFYYLTGEYIPMIFESILNNVSILSSHILNNMEFSTH